MESTHVLTPRVLTEVLDARSEASPDKTVYTFLRDGEVEEASITYAQLRQRALAVAERLTALNAPGERAILLYPQGLEFIVAFFGCLYAGVVAVPVSIPNRKRGLEILRRIAADSGAKWLLASAGLRNQLALDGALDTAFAGLAYLDTERLVTPALSGWAPERTHCSDCALLQYTSGSTGSPRGVVVTHMNLAQNQAQIEHSFGHDCDAVVVSWLPMFHDMGLGSMLQMVWLGGRGVLMSPRAFLQNPMRWLAAISVHKATSSGGPDFAFDLCVRRITEEQRKALDLSSWRVAFNGSEPVRASTIESFSQAFASCGFQRRAFHPVYGLAEITLLATSESSEDAPLVRHFMREALQEGRADPAVGSSGHALVSCGRPWLGTELRIVDPETRQATEPGRVGEIWLAGASVALGYWEKTQETAETFRALTADGRGPFLRTGDLGFVEDGHLFVTGRHKDLIIIRGQNHYPHDIEESVFGCHTALQPHACAVFAVDSGQGEQLVVVQEVARGALRSLDVATVIRSIRAAVSAGHALQTHAVVLIKPSTLPMTSSGKVRHKECQRLFLEGGLNAIASWTSPSPPQDAPSSERRRMSIRADRIIEWLRRHAADCLSTQAAAGLPALLRDFAKQGLLGLQVQSNYGGLGLGHFETARVLEQLAAIDFSLAALVGFNNYLGIQLLSSYAGPRTKALLLPNLAQGQELGAFAFEEPSARSLAQGLSAEARPDGDSHWRLYGTKYLLGVASDARVINVFVKHDEPPGVSAFVISQSSEGLRVVREGLPLGALGFSRDMIVMDGVRVSRENLLGDLSAGMDIAREAMLHSRLVIGAACIGGMKRCAQLVSRQGPYYGNINGKLTPNPVTLSKLGAVTARVTALECLVHRVAKVLDRGQLVPAEAFAACKMLGPELLLRSVDDLMQLGVAETYAETGQLAMLYRDAGLLRNYDGSPESVAELAGAAVMESDTSLRMLVADVLEAPDLVSHIDVAIGAVIERMDRLTGALARRAQRWGQTRAGELAGWLVLLAATEGVRLGTPSVELDRARAWALAQFEHALSAVRHGTPSETAALDASDVAAAFANYSGAIGDLDSNLPPSELGSLAASSPLEAGSSTRWTGLPQTGTRPESSTRGCEARPPIGLSKRELRSWIIGWLGRHLRVPTSQLELPRSFADYGLDSMAAVQLAKELSDKIGGNLDETLLWNFPTIDALVDHVVDCVAPDPTLEKQSATEAVSRSAPVSQLEDEIARLEQELRARS